MKITHILAAAAFCVSFSPISRANLLVTELNSDATLGDFWEITNFGATTVDLFDGGTPWSWDDDSDTPNSVILPQGVSLASGKSLVFLASGITDTTAFRSGWNIEAGTQVIAVGTSPGLGQNDRVTLFNGAGIAQVTFSYAASGFLRSNSTTSLGGHAGLSAGGSSAAQSVIWDPTSGTTAATARYTFADGTNFGSYDAPGSTGFGSPGLVTAVPEPATTAIGFAAVTALFVFFRRRKSARA